MISRRFSIYNISLIDSNSLYVRRITNGVSDVLLMEEEKEAIKKANENLLN